MDHSFDIEFAAVNGIPAAIIYRHLQFWIVKNKTNRRNFHEDRTWTYNSIRAFQEQFPYMGMGQIRGALVSMEYKEIILTGNFNTRKSDQTTWYAFVNEKIALTGLPAHLLKSQMDNQAKNPICDNNKSICDNNKSICDFSRALPDTQPNPYTRTQINKNNVGKTPDEKFGLDCRIKQEAVFLAEQLDIIFHPGAWTRRTFAKIIRYFIESAMQDPEKINWFKEAVEWAKVARHDGEKAGGKALFVATVKARTGYGQNMKLIPASGVDK